MNCKKERSQYICLKLGEKNGGLYEKNIMSLYDVR